MNIPDIKNDVKPPVRTNENAAVQKEGKAFVQQSGAQDHHVVEKVEKTDDARQQKTRLNKENAEQAARKAESELAAKDLKLKFNVIEENKTIQVEVRDSDDKVIKKIPADDIVKLTKSIRKHFPGSFVDKTF